MTRQLLRVMALLVSLLAMALLASVARALPPCETVHRLAADSDGNPHLWRPVPGSDGGWQLSPWCEGDAYPVDEALRLQLLSPQLKQARADAKLCQGELSACEKEAERLELCEGWWSECKVRRQEAEAQLGQVVKPPPPPHWTGGRVAAVVIAVGLGVGGVLTLNEVEGADDVAPLVTGASLLALGVGLGVGAAWEF